MPLDLDNYKHRETDLPQLKSSQTPTWNHTFALPRSFYTDKTYLAFQINDDLMQWEPSEYAGGIMLTVGELMSGPQEQTLHLSYYSNTKAGKANIKWSLVKKSA